MPDGYLVTPPEGVRVVALEASPHGPAPTVYTEADLLDGPEALMAALRREFTAYHVGPLAYSDGWLEDTKLAVVTSRIGSGSRMAADRGDAVLLKPGELYEHDGRVTIWAPRARMNCGVRPDSIRVIN